jgi:hypothetical protein
MNEKIEKLAIEAGVYYHDDMYYDDHASLQRFAELIVKECDLYARRNWDHGTLLGGDLLNYFGVER